MTAPPRPVDMLLHDFLARLRVFAIATLMQTACVCVPAAAAADEPVAPMPKFDILEFDVEGNSKLNDVDIERVVTPFLGPARTLNEVESARVALEKAYHDAGYLTVVVAIPEQKVDDGSVVLDVLEGQVERLHVKGAEFHPSEDIRRRVPELAEGKVPYFPEVQRELDIINRSPDLKATPVLKAGRAPGTVDVNLDVDDQLPLHGTVELSNHQTPYTEPLRLSATLHYDNLWQAGHSLSLTAQTAPQATEQAKVLALSYSLPVGTNGDSLSFYGVHSASNVPSFPTGVLGNSNIVGLRFALPLPATGNYSQTLSMGLDHKSVAQSLVLGGPGGPTTPTPSIAYVPLVASYYGAWLEDGGSTALDATMTLGLRGLLGNRDADFAAKRFNASAQYMALRAGLRQTTTAWRWTFSGRLETQLASGSLLPNEQYAAGGFDSVRGYMESERLGDEALRGSLELRSPSLTLGTDARPLRVAGVGFYDAAHLRTLHTLFPQPEYYLLRGAGLGLRVSAPWGLSFDLDLARALDDGQVTKARSVRVHSRLVWDF